MAARKLAKAPVPPQQQQQQPKHPALEEVVSSISFGAESSSDGGSEVADVRLRGQASRMVRGTVTDSQQQQQQQRQQSTDQQPRQRRTAYMPNKAPPPPPPPLTQHQSPAKPPERPASASSAATIVHQTVYTRAKEPDSTSRRTNLFAPTPRPLSQQPQPWAVNNGSLSRKFSSDSRRSLYMPGQQAGGDGHRGGGHTLKGRLTNLFRRKSRKPLPEQEQQRWAGNQTYWQQQQQQQQQRQRRHSGGSTPTTAFASQQQQPPPPQSPHQLASRKSLHTFTYTDAKIYHPNNNMQHIAGPANVNPTASAVATQSPGPRILKSQAPQPPPPSSTSPAAAEEDSSNRNTVWWDMRTMGATRSAYSTDVLLVRNPEPMPDYETETTRF
ncbi:hypothetical protein BOX15_Mlig000724g1 [Macrostomum lignano]|uniref:Uncharacterized protein n=1 Tax=Macrostomum lignano TaxID=282301 RepID=A0A267EJP4_9PLAT|nr:hypothetical protein BOX15_Mlig000724g1 [Macrostomum lignano]